MWQYCGPTIGRMAYGYEYLGLTERLVCTQTTERAYLSIAHTLNMQMGCVINGLAKTETIKDLAKAAALFSVICHCNKFTDLDSIHMKINGAIRCSGWMCLSNFNNLDIEIMNAISERIHSLMAAWNRRQTKFIVMNASISRLPLRLLLLYATRWTSPYSNNVDCGSHVVKYFALLNELIKCVYSNVWLFAPLSTAALRCTQFEHVELDLNEKFGIFITIQSVCHFGNEQKHTIVRMPTILKSYYRPIALAEHDNEFICYVMLLSDGFAEARVCDSFITLTKHFFLLLASRYFTMHNACMQQ